MGAAARIFRGMRAFHDESGPVDQVPEGLTSALCPDDHSHDSHVWRILSDGWEDEWWVCPGVETD